MAPVGPSPLSSGEHIRHVSRSISTSFPPIPITVQERGIPDAVYIAIHENTPFIPRTIQRISTLLSRVSSPITTSVSSQKRQTQILAIPTTYAGLNDGPAPGSVAGIVIGSVCGFLLILWLLYTCFNMGGGLGGGVGEIVEEEIVRHRSGSPRRDRSRSETIEISKSRSPPQPRERIIMEETRRVSRPPDPEPEETIDDIVEVIEEQSISPPPPSRRPSKRTGGGYRTVDPADFGGGRRSMRHVR